MGTSRFGSSVCAFVAAVCAACGASVGDPAPATSPSAITAREPTWERGAKRILSMTVPHAPPSMAKLRVRVDGPNPDPCRRSDPATVAATGARRTCPREECRRTDPDGPLVCATGADDDFRESVSNALERAGFTIQRDRPRPYPGWMPDELVEEYDVEIEVSVDTTNGSPGQRYGSTVVGAKPPERLHLVWVTMFGHWLAPAMKVNGQPWQVSDTPAGFQPGALQQFGFSEEQVTKLNALDFRTGRCASNYGTPGYREIQHPLAWFRRMPPTSHFDNAELALEAVNALVSCVELEEEASFVLDVESHRTK